MIADRVELVLRALSRLGCDPRPVGADAWQAPCPAHGGPYPALLVTRGADGSVSVKCRYVGPRGECCSDTEIWEELGLQPPPLKRDLAATAPVDRAREPGAQPSAAALARPEVPGRQGATLQQESSSPADHGAAPASPGPAPAPVLAGDVASRAPELCLGEPCGAGGAELRAERPDDRLQIALADDRPQIAARDDRPQIAAADDRPQIAAADDRPQIAAAADVAAADSGQRTAAVAESPRRSAPARAAARRSRRNDGSIAGMLGGVASEVRVVRGLDDRFYAQVPVDGHYETRALRSSSFKYWLALNYRRRHRAVPSDGCLNKLVRAFEADAAALGSAERVPIRVADGTSAARAAAWVERAGHPDPADPSDRDAGAVYYLDLGDPSWRSVEIRADGCRLIERAPVVFWRPRGLGPLPEPRWDGSIERLKKYTNVAPADFPLLVGWMAAALRPAGPYPILILSGEQGSAKSTTARVVRRLIDPSFAPLKGLPGSQLDFMIGAHNTWVQMYDNVSSISETLSNAFCRTATGGSFSTRSLYSNDSETLFDLERPAIVNGIDDFVHRSDLIDRCLFLHLPPIPDLARRPQQAFWSEFDAECPGLLGALLIAVAGGLKMLPQIDLPALPRMADFAQWGEAVIRGLGGQPGSFLTLYNANRRAASEAALDDCPVVQGLRSVVDIHCCKGPYKATASGLLETLIKYAPKNVTRSAQWPKNPRSLSCMLRRIAPQLRMTGIMVSFDRIDNTRTITVSPSAAGSVVSPAQPSPSP